MDKRIISLLLALVMILGLVPGTTANAWVGAGTLGRNDTMEGPAGNPFTDVPAGSFYEEPVLWALENGITTGATATTFNPGGACQRAAVVTFLWRAAGKPEPTSGTNPFVDVKETDFFYKAVLWAVEDGITNGSDANHFNPYGVCNRAQVVTFLHRAKGSPAPANAELPFTDVAAGVWYAAPVAWAVENGITNGLSATEFGPNAACNRAQVVTFLYRAYAAELSACDHAGLQPFEATAPTCTESGSIAYWYCADCAKYFSDADAATEIAFEDTILAATGHTPGAQATCTEPQICTVCSWVLDPATGHTEVTDAAVEATCTKTGLTEGSHCAVCNEVLVAQLEVPKKDHTPGAQATCTEDQVCTVCGEVLVSANGHIPGLEATCTEHQRCTVCQTVLAEATGHSLTYVEERDPVSADDPGNRAYWQCTICGKCFLDEAATKEIALADTAWEIYLIYFYDLENNTYTVGAYKQSEALFLKNIFPVEMKGYDFNSWHTSQYFTDENKVSVIPAGNTENLNLYANRSLHEYKITLLGLGREETWTYKITEGIQLATPKWKESAGQGDCLIFSHWSDENGDEITQIPAGEIGDRTIEANWIYKENYAISNPDKYTYVGGVADPDGKYSFIYEIGAINNIVLSKQHDYPFDGLTEHTESVTKTYSVGQSEGREAARTISEIISSSTEKTDIERYTTTHQEGWEAGAKWSPEVEFKGIKVSAWEFSGGYSDSDTDTYEEAGFTSEKNYEEDGTENEIRSTVDYYTEESESRTVSDTFIPGVTPVGNYTWARLMDVKVYAIVTYNPYTGKYAFDVYSVPTSIHNGLLYTLPGNLEYDVNIVSGDVLDFEIPFEDIPEMFYTVEYDANGGTGEMHKSVHELGVSSKLLSTSYTLNIEGTEKAYGFERVGYTFNRWTTAPDGTGNSYTDQFEIRDIAAAGETVTLYAQWTANTYKVYYDANGGEGTMEPSEHTYDVEKKLSTNTFSRTGYTFLGWSEEKDAVDAKYVPDASVKNLRSDAEAEITLYAVWDGNAYTVTYDGNGGTGTTGATQHKYGTPSNLAKNGFARAEHTFLGWSTDRNDTVAEFSAGQEVETLSTGGNVTLYAVWVRTEATVTISGLKAVTESDEVYDYVGIPLAWGQLSENDYTTLEVTISTYGEDGLWNGPFDAEDEWLVWVYDYGMTKELHFKNFGDMQGEAATIKTDFTVSISDIQEHGILVIEWGAGGAANDDWVRNGVTVTVKAKR